MGDIQIAYALQWFDGGAFGVTRSGECSGERVSIEALEFSIGDTDDQRGPIIDCR